MVIVEGWREGNGELLLSGHRVSVLYDEKFSGNDGDGCTTI